MTAKFQLLTLVAAIIAVTLVARSLIPLWLVLAFAAVAAVIAIYAIRQEVTSHNH